MATRHRPGVAERLPTSTHARPDGGLAHRNAEGRDLPARGDPEGGDRARKLGLASTGNASRSLASNPGIGAGNFYLSPGQHSPEQIIAGVS